MESLRSRYLSNFLSEMIRADYDLIYIDNKAQSSW